MRHRKGGFKLGRNPAHRRATLRNLVTNVIVRERVQTTLARARAAKPLVERMITLGKRDSLHTRRQAASFLETPRAVKKLFDELAPRFAERPGGYTRILRAGWRHGDNAAIAVLELVGSEMKVQEKEKKGKKKEEAAPPEKEE
ncbi:MAG TPA: 50S ribosomal protein L17 [Patescibacteria group bacterium]|nr:50S ribosomal protein L17 [Patescibacteria group bacterium]